MGHLVGKQICPKLTVAGRFSSDKISDVTVQKISKVLTCDIIFDVRSLILSIHEVARRPEWETAVDQNAGNILKIT